MFLKYELSIEKYDHRNFHRLFNLIKFTLYTETKHCHMSKKFPHLKHSIVLLPSYVAKGYVFFLGFTLLICSISLFRPKSIDASS